MVSIVNTSPLSALSTSVSEGLRSKMSADRTYKPAVLRNRVTGKREEIILVDFQDEDIETSFLAIPSNPELKADLSAALKLFSPIEKRILFRVLVQGQSVREATARMKRSARSWERWLSEKALPSLRACLEDYREEAERESSYLPSADIEVEEAPVPSSTIKCRFCSHVFTAQADVTALKRLREHCALEHSEQSKQIKAYVSERDDEIFRDKVLLHETRFLWAREEVGQVL